jgi:hypothetical protein
MVWFLNPTSIKRVALARSYSSDPTWVAVISQFPKARNLILFGSLASNSQETPLPTEIEYVTAKPEEAAASGSYNPPATGSSGSGEVK